MKKHASHIQAPEGNRRGQTSIHQDTKTMALVQYYQCEKHASPPGLEPGSLEYHSNALTTKLRRCPMKKHAPHIQAPAGNLRGQTSIHQDTKTMALVQYYQCEKHVSPPGHEPGSLEYRSNALTTKLRRCPMKKHAPRIQAPEGNRRGQTSIHQDTKTMALVQYYQCENHPSPPGH